MKNLMLTQISKSLFIISRAMLLFALLIFFQSCKDPDITSDTSISQQTGNDPQLQALSSFLAGLTGAPVNKVVYDLNEKTFIIDGDIKVTRSSAEGYLNADKASRVNQRQLLWLLKDEVVKDIKVHVASSIYTPWYEAVVLAMKDWNAIPDTKVHFQQTTKLDEADIRITAQYGFPNPDGSPNWVARQCLPNSDGTIGGGMEVNIYYNAESIMPLSKKRLAIAHELGHSIGLTHTDKLSGLLEVQVCDTPIMDKYSVMNSSVSNWKGFSKYDMKAVATMYPQHTWKYYPTQATDIAASSGKTQWLWTISKTPASGGYAINRYNYVTHQFLPVPGGALRIAVGPDGLPWIVNNKGEIYKMSIDSKWQKLTGSALDIAVGTTGGVHIISTVPAPGGFAIKYWKNNQWNQMPGKGAVRIAVSSTGVAWAIDNANKILKSNGTSMDDTGAFGRDIAAGGNGSVYAIGQTAVLGGYSVKKNENGCWVQLDGGGVAITAHGNGMGPAVINNLGMVMEY
ncbi:M57 family metalloprotease [Dyadobacter sp. CY261]|uniref:M57 family metalloprotease n=1 Tax=Dyadobacter sp. CY261 TaxID=2907203 RepID=UPI001F42EB6E|nr:M57 family metalloprotease [Dyadobacter sp. CY261]MCF0075589.1 M57 family metalloprotease [Dyadobacter sp. CY261]